MLLILFTNYYLILLYFCLVNKLKSKQLFIMNGELIGSGKLHHIRMSINILIIDYINKYLRII